MLGPTSSDFREQRSQSVDAGAYLHCIYAVVIQYEPEQRSIAFFALLKLVHWCIITRVNGVCTLEDSLFVSGPRLYQVAYIEKRQKFLVQTHRGQSDQEPFLRPCLPQALLLAIGLCLS